MTNLRDFELKKNLALVDILSPKESSEILNSLIDLDAKKASVQALVVEQAGGNYSVVKVVACSGQDCTLEGAKNQLDVAVGDYYVISDTRISYIGGVTTAIPKGFVNTQELLIHLDIKQGES